MNEQDALDQLYAAVQRLRDHQCDLEYIQNEVAFAYAVESSEVNHAD